ncbi:MAG: hypothetical protein JXR29_13655 [Methylothermaceae bacterium]|nr:hypothetical protein [Methylothermaceae bacterium]
MQTGQSFAATSHIVDEEGRRKVEQLLDAIGRAENLQKARNLALEPTDAALGALDTARTLMPANSELESARKRLMSMRDRIAAADSPDRVANEMEGLMLAGLDDDSAVKVDVGGHGCHYSTGETIAIIIGLILGIIPGLIMLVVLC